MTDILLSSGAIVNHADDEGFTALILAAGYSMNPKVLDHLIEAGADLDKTTNTGGSALLWATWYGLLENVRGLVKAGANKELVSNGKCALDIAREKQLTEIEALLAER